MPTLKINIRILVGMVKIKAFDIYMNNMFIDAQVQAIYLNAP
jgi:hypothetical protein